jgi:acetoacetate decarboxylase
MGAGEGPAALQPFQRARVPVAATPVPQVASGVLIVSDLSLDHGRVVYDYLYPGRRKP